MRSKIKQEFPIGWDWAIKASISLIKTIDVFRVEVFYGNNSRTSTSEKRSSPLKSEIPNVSSIPWVQSICKRTPSKSRSTLLTICRLLLLIRRHKCRSAGIRSDPVMWLSMCGLPPVSPLQNVFGRWPSHSTSFTSIDAIQTKIQWSLPALFKR